MSPGYRGCQKQAYLQVPNSFFIDMYEHSRQ
jgi:hypothetical protein